MKHDELASKIEESYKSMTEVLSTISSMNGVMKNIENAAKEVSQRYNDLMNMDKLHEIKEGNDVALKKIIEDVETIEKSITVIDAIQENSASDLKSIVIKMNQFEENFKKVRKTISEVDDSVAALLKQAEKRHFSADDKVNKMSKLIDIGVAIEKYDILLKLEQENNHMLKDIQKQLSHRSKGRYDKPKPNTPKDNAKPTLFPTNEPPFKK